MRVLALVVSLAALTAAAADKPEPGFTPIFNGKSFDGWKEQKGGVPLDGKATAYDDRFQIAGEAIVIDPAKSKSKAIVWIETAKEFGGDLTLKLDYKPDAKCNNDTMLLGNKFDLNTASVKGTKAGEWNTLEIVVAGGKAEYKVNGETVKSFPKVSAKSPFGLRAEFGSVEVKNLRVKEAK